MVMFAAAHALMIAIASAPQAAPPPAEAAPTTVALVETYADGRTTYELVSARPGKMWTPYFPRIEGYKPPDDAQPVFAVQIARVLSGRDIKASVSVLLRFAVGEEIPVADVVITPGSRIVVDGLRKFGIEPITLSMATIAPMTPYYPTVVSVTPLIEIANVEVLSAPYPGYRITLRNLSNKGVSNAHVQSYRGEEKALSGLRRDESGRAMMKPGGTYTFDVNLTSGTASGTTTPGTWSPRPLDVIEIDAVRWEDATYDGVPPYPKSDAAIEANAGNRVQLERIIEAFRQTLNAPGPANDRLAALRARMDALPAAEPDQLAGARQAMRAMKAAAVADVRQFERDTHAFPGSNAFNDWLTYTLKRYEVWLKRVAPGR